MPTGETGDEEAAHGHRRVRSRHWTEMGDSIGGYDELNFGSGEFLFITVWAIRMTSCFVYRISHRPGRAFTSPGRARYERHPDTRREVCRLGRWRKGWRWCPWAG